MTESEQDQSFNNHGVVESGRDAKKINYYIQLIERMEGRKAHNRRNEQAGDEAEIVEEKKRHHVSNPHRRGSESSLSGQSKGQKAPHDSNYSNADDYPGKPGHKPLKTGKKVGRPSLASLAAAVPSRTEIPVQYSPSQPSPSVGLRGRRRRPGSQHTTPTISNASPAPDSSSNSHQAPVLPAARRGRPPRSALVTTVDQRVATINEAAARNGVTPAPISADHLQPRSSPSEFTTPTHGNRRAVAQLQQQRLSSKTARETNTIDSATSNSSGKSSLNTKELKGTLWSSEGEADYHSSLEASARDAKRVKHHNIEDGNDIDVDNEDNDFYQDGDDLHADPTVPTEPNTDEQQTALNPREVQFRDAFTALSEDYQLLLPPLPTTHAGMQKLVRTVTANLMLNAVSCLNKEKLLAVLSG